MPAEQIPAQRRGPDGDQRDQRAHPVVPVPAVDLTKTCGTAPGTAADDVPAGVIEYRSARPTVLYRTATAAMVAASVTGRAVGLTARAARSGGRWFRHGAWSTAVLGYRYVRAHDHQEALGGITTDTDWRKVQQTRRSRWRFLTTAVTTTAALDVAGWWALVRYGHLTAADTWAILPGTETLAAVTALTLYGRYRLANRLAPQEIVAGQDVDDGEPFPLAWCTKPEEVIECVTRALAYEGVGTRRVELLAQRPWGWEIDVTLRGSTPGKVLAVCDQLDSHFDIARGATMIETDPDSSAHLVLRLRTSDPFAAMPAPAIHPPNSLDISDPHTFGLSMDGEPLQFVIEGNRILVLGISGSAKSTGVLRDLAEVITACHNAILLDLDPVKDGLREFEGVTAVPPVRGNTACEEWLAYLVRMAEARNRVRNRLGMGDTWVATSQHPAIVVAVDEFIYLSTDAKENFIRLLRLGKQSGIYPIAAGQDATSDSLGDAIADSFTLRVMLASRHADITLVFGKGAIAAGYRPDRLQPAQNKQIKRDAGRCYIQGLGQDRPLLYGWHEISREQVTRAVAERVEAGRPWFDHDTLAEAGLLHLATEYGPLASPGAARTLADRLDQLAVEQHSPDAATLAALLRLFTQHEAGWLPTAVLTAAGVVDDGAELQKLLVRLVPAAKSTRDLWDGKQARGWDRTVIEQAATVLFAPS